VRRVVNLRLKGPSLFWCRASAEAILLLRSYYKGGSVEYVETYGYFTPGSAGSLTGKMGMRPSKKGNSYTLYLAPSGRLFSSLMCQMLPQLCPHTPVCGQRARVTVSSMTLQQSACSPSPWRGSPTELRADRALEETQGDDTAGAGRPGGVRT